MKRLISIIVLMAIVAGSIYANGFSALQLRSHNNQPMTVFINGHIYSQNTSFVEIHQIAPGNVRIRVNQLTGHGMGQPGVMHTIFNGNVFIPGNTLTSAVIFPHQFIVENQQPLMVGNLQPVYPIYGSPVYGHPAYGWNNPQPVNPVFPNHPVQPVHPGWNGNHYGHIPPHFGPTAMAPDQFSRLKQSIRNQSFSSGQRQVAEQALNSNMFTSQQVFELVNMFTFNSDKLHIAKRAYLSTIDRENFFVVYDALDFNSSVNELAGYIASL